ncbi:MAG TPA: type II secretion system protein [Candidatus Methylacidiphilales bacterium]|nr:type II secretion system protein [Candidatus Methylacidiphilales bacterium]
MRHSKCEVAFTLVEVLVAEAIFLILLLVVMQLIFGALQATTAQKKRMDELGDARQSLDRLSLDWTGRVRRSDLLASFSRQVVSSTNAANAQISFFTQEPAYSGARHLSWVSYAINNITQVNQGSQTTTSPALERGILGYNWAASDPTGAANPLLTLPASAPTGTVTFDPLASTVFRFDYCFLQQVTTTGTSPFTTNNPSDTANPADPNVNLSSTNIVGIVVAVASLDQQSRQIVSQAQLVTMGQSLPAITNGGTPQAQWVSAINTGTYATSVKSAGVPTSVANAVHVYQRILYVND